MGTWEASEEGYAEAETEELEEEEESWAEEAEAEAKEAKHDGTSFKQAIEASGRETKTLRARGMFFLDGRPALRTLIAPRAGASLREPAGGEGSGLLS